MRQNIDLSGPWSAVSRAPMLRLALPVVIGIAIARAWQPPLIVAATIFIVASAVSIYFTIGTITYEGRWKRGLALFAWLFVFGIFWMQLRSPATSPRSIVHVEGEEGPWLVRLNNINRVTPSQLRADAGVEAMLKGDDWTRREGTIMLTLLRNEDDPTPRVGDRMLVQAPMKRIMRIPDPGGFDRQVWAAARGIELELFATRPFWNAVDHTVSWVDHFSSLRRHISSWVDAAELGERERALVKALVLGQRDELDGELRTAFARSGTIHVLAVSGLHVGLIYAVLGFLLKWLGGSRRSRVIRGIVIILALWVYAGITGAAPSILRATMMFSFISIADMTARRAYLVNSLFAAMFLLVLWDPRMTGIIGFQLSFLAVLGIVLFHSSIEALYTSRFWVVRQIWSLAVLSVSAQLLTMPVSLYYFKAFPLWFLPANIIVVVAVVFSVQVSLALIVLHKVPLLGKALAMLLTGLLKVVAEATSFFASMPNAYPSFRIDPLMMFLLFAMIFSVAAWWQWKWHGMRWVTGITTCMLLFAWALNARSINRNNTFTLYDERVGVLASFTNGRQYLVMGDQDKLVADPYTQRKIEQHRKAAGLNDPEMLHLDRLHDRSIEQVAGSLAAAGRWTNDAFDVLFVDSPETEIQNPWGSVFDVVVLHDMEKIPDRLLEQAAATSKHVVLAGRTSWHTRENVTEWFGEKGIPFHDIFAQGAFILERP